MFLNPIKFLMYFLRPFIPVPLLGPCSRRMDRQQYRNSVTDDYDDDDDDNGDDDDVCKADSYGK
jgi:hypothetical protein